ncbi:MAG: hypothetical protein RLN85_17770, partial [Pseudomonadales bacterium]
ESVPGNLKVLRHRRAVRAVARRIDSAINLSLNALREGRVEQEPAMTDRMLGAIEQKVQGDICGIKWSAKTLTDRGTGSQESEFGADFMGVLQIDLPDYKVSKGFLAQAKMSNRSSKSDLAGVKRQCEKMLKFSPESFVFIYDKNGVRVVPAIGILATEFGMSGLYSRPARRFFEEHLECFIGDRRISCPSPNSLDNLRHEYQARSALLLIGSENTDV